MHPRWRRRKERRKEAERAKKEPSVSKSSIFFPSSFHMREREKTEMGSFTLLLPPPSPPLRRDRFGHDMNFSALIGLFGRRRDKRRRRGKEKVEKNLLSSSSSFYFFNG